MAILMSCGFLRRTKISWLEVQRTSGAFWTLRQSCKKDSKLNWVICEIAKSLSMMQSLKMKIASMSDYTRAYHLMCLLSCSPCNFHELVKQKNNHSLKTEWRRLWYEELDNWLQKVIFYFCQKLITVMNWSFIAKFYLRVYYSETRENEGPG